MSLKKNSEEINSQTDCAKTETVCDINKEHEDNEKIDSDAPEDKFQLIFILIFLLGLFHLLPWSFFTTATEFWMYKFRNTSIEETNSELRTELQAQFNSTLRVTLQISDVMFLFLTWFFGHYIKVRTRMIGVLCIILTLFALITVFVKVDTDSWQTGFFVLVMAITAGINATNAVFTITLYTALASFPHHYLAAYLMGSALARVFTASLQILSLSLQMSVQDSALVYFGIGIFVIAFTLVLLVSTGRNKFYVYYMGKIKDDPKEKISFRETIRLGKKIWSSVVMMGLNLLTTDACPTALVVSEGEGNGPWNDQYFIPTITYFLAAVCALVGRGLAIKFVPNWSGIRWTIVITLRLIIFVPLFMFSNAQPRSHLPVLLPHDYQYIIMITVFNLTGGYLLSRCSYNITNLVTKEELKKAYHVNMICSGVQMVALSFVSILSVELL
jgi:equilibrative nucleoside transporter 1/2/3